MFASIHRAALGVSLAVAAGPTLAADPPAAGASAPNEEVPIWAVGMPKGNKLAPVPSFPIATPVDTVACRSNDRRAFAQLPMPSVAHVPRLKRSKRGI
jgi:hypothetical protein